MQQRDNQVRVLCKTDSNDILANFTRRACRQRKKEHVESLKHQLDQLQQTADKYRALQAENNALREYALKLRTELLWSQGTLPDPPNGISLAGPHTDRLFAEIKALLSQENENGTQHSHEEPKGGSASSDHQHMRPSKE